ncbi:MAG TPA: hypothetical protein VMU05_14440 [Dongiaceae bacterium]|nr:hypothetical protein [Dongiaceae bacterium]
MSRHQEDNNGNRVRVELKYCEACGGLWVRECGAGAVYCEKCQARVDELPFQKKRPGRVRLPQGPREEMEAYRIVFDEEATDLEAVGGVSWGR